MPLLPQQRPTTVSQVSSSTRVFPLFRALALVVVVAALLPSLLHARQPSLSLTKTASVDTVDTGVMFTWTISYSISSTNDPAQDVVITDVLPASLLLAAGNVQLIGNPQTASTSYNAGTGTATFTMVNPLPAGSSGQVQINVMFAPGTTPNGTIACNTATITASNAAAVTSNQSCVVARAVHRFTFQKDHYAGNALNGTVVYRLRVINPTGNSIGGLNLNGATFSDTLQPGAVFVSATGPHSVTGQVVTWTLGNLVVSPWYNPWFVDYFLTVQYPAPPFTQGQSVCNTGWLKGTPVGWSGTFAAKDSACLTLVAPLPGVQLLKGPYYSPMTNRVPGCTGFYSLSPGNTGNVAIDSFKVTDVLPQEVMVTSFSTGSYVNFPANSVTIRYRTTVNPSWTTAGPYTGYQTISVYGAPSATNLGLASGVYLTELQWDYGTVPVGFATSIPAYINFTLLTNNFVTNALVVPGNIITNCATLTWQQSSTPGTPVTHCKQFTVDNPQPVLSLNKAELSQGPYFPGDTITFRIRFWNIGAASLTGVTVTDVLPMGLQYVTTVSYAGGGGGPNPSTLGPSISTAGQTVTWSFSQPFPAAACGSGTNFWYDIVFTAVVTIATPPGTVCNTFTIGATNHPTVGSNQACVVINSVPAMESQKRVRGSLDSSFTLSGTTVAGGSADYELTVTNTGNVTMKDIVIVDILPFVGDVGVINWSVSRGSTWQANLIAPITAPPGTSVYYSMETSPCRSDLGLAGPPGCTGPVWYTYAGLIGGGYSITQVRSVKLDFGTLQLAPGQSVTVSWPTTAPTGIAAGQFACNSFGYRARRADNNAVVGPAEPLKVCVEIKPPQGASVGNFVWIDADMDGVQDAGESGLNGVQVELWQVGPDNTPYTGDDAIAVNLASVPIPFVMTANNGIGQPGYYLFTNLPPNTYYVRFAVPPMFTPTLLNAGTPQDDSDADPVAGPTFGWTAPFTLAANAADTTIDMGLHERMQVPCDGFRADVKPASTGACCWDLTFSMPPPSATMTITAVAPATLTSLLPPSGWTATPALGTYPTTSVDVLAPSVQSGPSTLQFCAATGGTSPQTFIITWSDAAGLVLCSDTIRTDCPKDTTGTGPGGVKFHDLNGDGTQGANEPGLGGWVIQLVPAGGGKPLETTTRPDGRYQFGTVPAGVYHVVERQQRGWVQTAPSTSVQQIVVAPGTTLPPVDFGNTIPPCDRPTDTVRIVAGTVDQFVGPEPSSPSASLLAWNTANYGLGLTGFDGEQKEPKGLFFGHTFSGFGKPGCVLMGAKLRLRIRANGPTSANDGIGIVAGSTLAWYHTIAPLTVGGTWITPQTETIILDLGALPPGQNNGSTSVLAAMASGTFNIFIQNHTVVDYIGIEVYICCPDAAGKAELQGCKFHDLDGDGVWDPGEPTLAGWTINLSNGQSVTTGQDGCYTIVVPAPATYVVSEATVYPWVQTYPANPATHTVSVQPGQSVGNLDFGNVKYGPGGTTTECDSLISATLDSACCHYAATIQNNVGAPITSISWSMTGGTMTSFTTLPCASYTPPAAGSTSGVLLYSPPCPGNMQFAISATPTTASGWVSVTLVVHHGEKDSCRLTFRWKCERAPVTACDSVNVKPFLFTGLDLSGRTFTVYNVKVPASPITSITITGTPAPCFLQGGALSIDMVSTPWSVPYTRIPITGSISANSIVKFNLGVDYTCGWTGAISLVIHHADGDSCTYTYGPWAATPPSGTGGVVVSVPVSAKRLYATRLRVRNTQGRAPVKWISVEVLDQSDRMFAGSGMMWDGTTREPGEEPVDEHRQGRAEALFGLTTAVLPGRESESLNLVVARDSARAGIPAIRWTTYDERGNALTSDTLQLDVPVLSVRNDVPSSTARGFELLSAFPNPAANLTTVNYLLGSEMDLEIELYDNTGARVALVESGRRASGVHAVRLDVGALPTGTYYLRMRTDRGMITKPLTITR